MTMQLIECIEAWDDLIEGDIYGAYASFFYNGETWYVTRDKDGNLGEYPTVFFEEYIIGADPVRAAFYGDDEIIEKLEGYAQ